MNRSPRQAGYVLLIVMMVLTIAATTLTAIARGSFSRMARAGREQTALQRHWGELSCQQLLPKAETILPHQEAEPISRVTHTLRLGDLDFHLVFSDEQAKLNLAKFIKRQPSRLERAVRELQASSQAPLVLTLSVPDDPKSFDEVFVVGHPSELLASSEQLTLWGSGKVNVRRASPAVIEAVLDGELSRERADSIAALIQQDRGLSVEEAISQLSLRDADARTARKLLTDASDCHSLWIITDDGVRKWYRLAIDQAGQVGVLAW